jgi:dimethylamine corrinoid protein
MKRKAGNITTRMNEELIKAMSDLERDRVLALVEAGLEAGEEPQSILKACQQGMTVIGDRFQTGDFFLAELILSGQILQEVNGILEPYLQKTSPPIPIGSVVLATLSGDIHDLGKNIFGSLLKAQGFEVHDLGVDIKPAVVIEKVKMVNPEFVGFSCLITTAFPAMKEAVDMLVEAGLRNHLKVMIGGGVTTSELAEYVKADFQTTDAPAGVKYCLDTIKRGES